MFGIGPLELVVITIVAVLFIGPEKLPDAMRKFGKFFVQIRRHANDVKGGFQEIIHDAERELELEKIRELQAKLQNVSPSSMLEAQMHSAMNPPPAPPDLHAPGTEPYDYHESHYKDGVYTETGPEHMNVPDPILQPDPPAGSTPGTDHKDKDKALAPQSPSSAPAALPSSASTPQPSPSPSPPSSTASTPSVIPPSSVAAADKPENPFEKKVSPGT